jgi:hypothetical protein
MEEVLNHELHAVLSDIFKGEVEVINPGEPGTVLYDRESGKYYARPTDTSQQFRVNCPFCGDTRGRLFISYLVGADLRHRGQFVRTHRLLYCQNENCRTYDLYKQIKEGLKEPPTIIVPKTVEKARVDIKLPAPNFPINSPKAHQGPAKYMESRGFDLEELSVKYGVRTCAKISDVEHLGQMILFPYYDGDKLTFWQARMCYDPDNKRMPKYYFPPGAHKSEVVYNRYNALTEQMVVITEGVLDAIRVGDSGVAIFGKHPSVAQTRIMSRAFRRKMGVLMLDADADKEATKWYEKYKGDALFEKGLFICRLEKGDPADHTRDELWDLIIQAVKEGSKEQ